MVEQKKTTTGIELPPLVAMAAKELPALSRQLLQWYDAGARVLPWREAPTPYRVWVSEIMLQQTRVEAVRPYFLRFIEALPDVAALASVQDDVLLKLWEGLGYYNRARNLKRAAQQIMELYDGVIPKDYEALLALPGVGDYTAGAIASIAYNQPLPAVDGNVLRVLARLLAWDADITKEAVKKRMRSLACSMQCEDRPGDFNQAMMELGATICLPGGEPHCGLCPMAHACSGLAGGLAQQLPVKAAKKPRRQERRTILVVVMDGRVLLHRRAAQGLLADLWEFPGVPRRLSKAEVAEKVMEWGTIEELSPLDSARHIFSHVEWHMTGWLIFVKNAVVPENFAFATWQEVCKRYALPSAFETYVQLLSQILKEQS